MRFTSQLRVQVHMDGLRNEITFGEPVPYFLHCRFISICVGDYLGSTDKMARFNGIQWFRHR